MRNRLDRFSHGIAADIKDQVLRTRIPPSASDATIIPKNGTSCQSLHAIFRSTKRLFAQFCSNPAHLEFEQNYKINKIDRPSSGTTRRNKAASSDVFQSIGCAKRIFPIAFRAPRSGFQRAPWSKERLEGIHLRRPLCALDVLRVRPSSSRGERNECEVSGRR